MWHTRQQSLQKNKKYIESTGGQLKKWYAHISDIKYGKKQRNRT